MAPSRGVCFFAPLFSRSISTFRISQHRRAFSDLPSFVADPNNKVQSYISRSNDPYLNLSIEDYLLRHSRHDSAILFLYTNRPCVVIGRNQNPWLEVNLNLLDPTRRARSESAPKGEIGRNNEAGSKQSNTLGRVDLVRRRSGGGAVFHDSGNVNWSVICPRPRFTRDLHAEMVVRALQSLGVPNARVNVRHDIVLDQTLRPSDSDSISKPPFLKVAGSAYKLIRGRALHHGTCLLNSPNLSRIGEFLRSPARPYLLAKGVESVSSPVGNIGVRNEDFEQRVHREFIEMYSPKKDVIQVPVNTVGEEQLGIADIRKVYKELQSPHWTYAQMPQFSLSSSPINEQEQPNQKKIPRIEAKLPEGILLNLNVQHGIITECHINTASTSSSSLDAVSKLLLGIKLEDVHDWRDLLGGADAGDEDATAVARWLNEVLPVVHISDP